MYCCALLPLSSAIRKTARVPRTYAPYTRSRRYSRCDAISCIVFLRLRTAPVPPKKLRSSKIPTSAPPSGEACCDFLGTRLSLRRFRYCHSSFKPTGPRLPLCIDRCVPIPSTQGLFQWKNAMSFLIAIVPCKYIIHTTSALRPRSVVHVAPMDASPSVGIGLFPQRRTETSTFRNAVRGTECSLSHA